MPIIRQLFKSMQFQLIFWSVLALLLLAVVAGGYGFWHSYEEINEFQDDNLKSMAAVLEQTLDIESSSSSSLPKTNIHFDTDDDDGSITVDIISINISNTDTSTPITYNSTHDSLSDDHNQDDFDDITVEDLPFIAVGISTKIIDDDTWRVYRSDSDRYNDSNGDKQVIIVRQRTEFQDELAQASALQSFLPLIIGMAFLMLLLPFITWRMLQPVRQLQREIGQRRESDLDPLSVSKLPTELLPLAESLNRLLAQVKTSIERQQRFIADAAHELRSPLTAISLQLQRLQRLSNDEVMTTGLAKLAIRLKRNQSLVEQLLTLARAGNINATANTEAQAISLTAMVEQVIGLLIPIIDNKNIALTVDLPADSLLQDQVNIDETSLLLLVKNLIQNAIVYTPNNGQVAVKLFHLAVNNHNSTAAACKARRSFGTQVLYSTKVNKRSKPLQNQLILQIMDNGQGMDPKDYASAFEPFVRLRQSSKQSNQLLENPTDSLRSDNAGQTTTEIDGTGLGLSIVKSICERANIEVFMSASTLTASNGDENRGLCVTLIF